jgi:hypothetical protein
MQFLRRKVQKVHYSAVFEGGKKKEKALNAEAERRREKI